MYMELYSEKSVGYILTVGSLLFLVAAFMPISRVYVEPSPEQKIELIMASKIQWNISMVFFVLGSIITAVGLGLFVFRSETSVRFLIPAYIGSAIILIGALLWSWHVIERIISPEGFARGTNTPFLFVLYSILTQFGLILLGIFLLYSNYSNWVGKAMIAGISLLFILMLIFKDMPPFVYYIFTMILAVVLIVASGKGS